MGAPRKIPRRVRRRHTGAKPDWDAEARYYRYEDPESGEYVQLPMDEARDGLILGHLEQGDPRPLIHFLRSEHELGRNVRAYLAGMLDDSTLPWRLIVVDRRKKLNRNPYPHRVANRWRDFRAYQGVRELIVSGAKYTAAIEQVADEMGMTFSLTKLAYDEWRKRA